MKYLPIHQKLRFVGDCLFGDAEASTYKFHDVYKLLSNAIANRKIILKIY